MVNGSHDKHKSKIGNHTNTSNNFSNIKDEDNMTPTTTTTMLSDDEDDPYGNENDEDYTARLSDERKLLPSKSAAGPDDNMTALQRVKSLAQRNRMVWRFL